MVSQDYTALRLCGMMEYGVGRAEGKMVVLGLRKG